MAAAGAVLLVTAVLLCTSAYALEQDDLREMIASSRTDVIDAHAMSAPPELVPGEPTSETDGWLRKQLRLFPGPT